MEKTIKKIEYEYKGKNKRFGLIECDRLITTICEVIENESGEEFDIEVIEEGMTREELVALFPPDANGRKAGLDFCLLDMMRSIIWEAYRDLGTDYEGGNVRHFWYTHLKYVVEDVLKMGETSSVAGAINNAWANLVDSGLITYEGLKIVSDKESARKSQIRDSPFNNLLIAVEVKSLFEEMTWIPELFNTTLMTAGGQPSRSVSRNFARQLVDELTASGVDIHKDLYMCTISDLDPAGYYIQRSFKNQIEKALEYYGSNAQVHIKRLFVKPSQVTPNLLKHKAMKCEDVGAKNEKARKAENTKWAYFCDHTRTATNPEGGLYKTDGTGTYRAKLELEAFPMSIIERNVLNELLKIIRDTSDESLIMIPEIMRIFNRVGKDVVEEIFQRHKEDWLKPIIEAFLSQADELETWFDNKTEMERQEESDRWHEIIDPIKDTYTDERTNSEALQIDEEAEHQNIIDAYKEEKGHDVRLDEIDDEIQALEDERSEIDNDVAEACEEQFDEITATQERHSDRLEEINEREKEELKPFKDDHELNNAEIDARGEYRQSKLDEFKRWQVAEFNPVDIELRKVVEEALNPHMDFRYRKVESDDRTKPHISKLLNDPDALLEDDVSAWDQEDYPIFTETDCLEKAAMNSNLTVEPHRRGFTTDLTDAMSEILHEAGDDVEVEYPDAPEFDDLTVELESLQEQVEKDIENGRHQEEEEEDTDTNDETENEE